MAFTYDQTAETVDPAALRTAVNNTVSDFAPNLVLTGYFDSATLPAANSDVVIGVTRATIKAGQRGSVMVRGQMYITAGSGGVTKGQRLMPEAATGKVVTWAPSSGSNATVVGVAQTDAAANALVLVELSQGSIGQG